MSTRLFVDETKAKGFVVVAAVAQESNLDTLRRQLRPLILPGQRSLHMNAERDSRRRAIADTIAGMATEGLSATIYDAGRRGKTELDSRGRCIQAIVRDALDSFDSAHILFDLDETLRQFDRQRLVECTRRASGRITYDHARRQDELLLAVPDAIAWCWARGRDWRRRVADVVSEVHDVI